MPKFGGHFSKIRNSFQRGSNQRFNKILIKAKLYELKFISSCRQIWIRSFNTLLYQPNEILAEKALSFSNNTKLNLILSL